MQSALRQVGILLAFLALNASQVNAATSGREGWDGGNLAGWQRFGVGVSVHVEPSGGNPGGYLRATTTTGSVGTQVSSGPFVGDYAAASIRRIAMDLQFFGAAGTNPYLRLRESPSVSGWVLVLAPTGPNDGVWHHYDVPIDPTWSDAQAQAAGWQDLGSPNASFAETLASVDYVIVGTGGVSALGVDNFSLATEIAAIPVEVSLSLELPRLSVTRTVGPVVASAAVSPGGSGHLESLILPSLSLSTTFLTPASSSVTPGIAAVGATLGPISTGTLSAQASPGSFGGVLPLTGALHLCVIDPGCGLFNLDYAMSRIGRGGTFTATVSSAALTLIGAPWTVRSVSLMTSTSPSAAVTRRTGFVHTPVSGTGLSGVALASGVLQLVTPFMVRNSLALPDVPGFATLTVRFGPEPRSAALLLSGAGLLVALGRRRMTVGRRREERRARHVL